MWIGYDDADSLLTYPQVNNLSGSAQPIRMRPLGFVPAPRSPCHPGAASVGVAFPVSRRPKARVTHKHTEVLSMLWD